MQKYQTTWQDYQITWQAKHQKLVYFLILTLVILGLVIAGYGDNQVLFNK